MDRRCLVLKHEVWVMMLTVGITSSKDMMWTCIKIELHSGPHVYQLLPDNELELGDMSFSIPEAAIAHDHTKRRNSKRPRRRSGS